VLEIVPVKFDEACEFIAQVHRHHEPPQGWMWGCAVSDGQKIVGVVMVGRPVARHRDDGWTLEAIRCCTDGTKNACSKLYAAAWRASRALGYRRLGTYLLKSESGDSMRAAGWRIVHETKGGSWSRDDRPRVDKHPTEAKTLWEISAGAEAG
jgi:hypothetical protein